MAATSEEEIREAEFERMVENRLKKLKRLDDKYEGAVTRLMWRIGHIIKDFNTKCDEIWKEREKQIEIEKKKEPKEMLDMMKKVKNISEINKEAIKKIKMAEKEQSKKLDQLLESLPPKLREELEKD